jgi:hypothetical protein
LSGRGSGGDLGYFVSRYGDLARDDDGTLWGKGGEEALKLRLGLPLSMRKVARVGSDLGLCFG